MDTPYFDSIIFVVSFGVLFVDSIIFVVSFGVLFVELLFDVSVLVAGDDINDNDDIIECW